MYNDELKKRFIAECSNNKSDTQRMLRLFGISEQFENEWHRDICTMPEDELGGALEAMTSARLGAQSVDMSILRKYARWCISNGVQDACEGLLQSQDVGYDKLRATMVDSPEQLQKYLDAAFSPLSDCRQDILCRGLYWIAYMGFNESEAAEIKTEHVDLKNSVIRFNGRSYPIYADAIPVIRLLCSANSFIYDYTRYESVVERDAGTLLLRGVRSGAGVNTDSIGRLACRRVSAVCKVSGENIVLRYRGLRYSGIFYRMLQDEMATGKADAEKYLKFYFSNTSEIQGRRASRKKVELSTDYQRWKIAFNK